MINWDFDTYRGYGKDGTMFYEMVTGYLYRFLCNLFKERKLFISFKAIENVIVFYLKKSD